MHFAAYLPDTYRRVELNSETEQEARHRAAMLLDTKREHSITLIECPQRVSIAELEADTED